MELTSNNSETEMASISICKIRIDNLEIFLLVVVVGGVVVCSNTSEVTGPHAVVFLGCHNSHNCRSTILKVKGTVVKRHLGRANH